MKFMKRTGIYKASNVTFNPQTCEAVSYAWWRFVSKKDGLVFFNNYRYSPSTGRQQTKVRRLMEQLGIKIDVVAPFPKGLPNEFTTLEELILLAEENMCDAFLAEESKRIERNEKAAARRAAKREAKLAEFKRNVESITPQMIAEYQAEKAKDARKYGDV